MIDLAEISPSGRAFCRKCGNQLKKLEIRGKTITSNFDEYICEKCLKEFIENLDGKIKKLKLEIKGLFDMSNQDKEDYLLKVKLIKKLK